MKRWPLALAVLFGPAVLPALADFLVLKVDLNKIQIGPPMAQPTNAVPFPMGEGAPGGGEGMAIPMPQMAPPGEGQPPAAGDSPPFWITAYLDLKKVKVHNQQLVEIDHKWGKQFLLPILPGITPAGIKKKPLAVEFGERLNKETKGGKEKTPVKLLTLADWALSHGLAKQFHETMAELKKVDPKHPAGLAYTRVQTALKKASSGEDPAVQELANELRAENYRPASSEHYTMLTNLPAVLAPETVKRRLKLLEETYENFYYWFALQDQVTAPPMPAHRLLAVLVANPKEFYTKHVFWGSQPMIGDGFTPRRDNVLILSHRPLDDRFGVLERTNQNHWNTYLVTREDLVTGNAWKRNDLKTNFKNAALLQTLSVLHKALEEEAERLTTSHEGTRQLLAATGLLPRAVIVPEWIRSGWAGFFEVPRGSFYAGPGLANWQRLVQFKHFRKAGKLGRGQDALLQLITDGFFRQANALAKESLESGDFNLSLQAREQADLAAATSWSLVYYLAHNGRLPQLMKYCQELNQLPRDLDLDVKVLKDCFYRAFGLTDITDFNRLAEAWFGEMENVSLELPEVEQEGMRQLAEPPPRAPAMPAPKMPEAGATSS